MRGTSSATIVAKHSDNYQLSANIKPFTVTLDLMCVNTAKKPSTGSLKIKQEVKNKLINKKIPTRNFIGLLYKIL